MEYSNLLALYNKDNFINDVLTPAWHEYDRNIRAIFQENINSDKSLLILEASARFVSGVAYKLLGMNLAKKMSNPVIQVSSDDAINIYLAREEKISLSEARKIEEEDKKLILREKIKEEAKKIFEGECPLISNRDINNKTPYLLSFSGELYGVEAIKNELSR